MRSDDTHRCVAPDGDGGFCENEAIGRFEVDEGDRMLRADFCVEHEPGYEPVEYLNTDPEVDA